MKYLSRYRSQHLVVSLLLGSLLIGAQSLWAQPPHHLLRASTRPSMGLTPDQLWTFANQLMREGEYYRAITEYHRFRFLYPNEPRSGIALYHIGASFYRGKSYAEALQTFREVVQQYPDTAYAKQAQLFQGESLLQQTKYAAAEQVYRSIIEESGNDKTISYAHYQLGWSKLYQRQWQAASDEWAQIPSTDPLYLAAQQLGLESRAGSRLPKKSPSLAGLLSGVLPGSGQLYNNRFGDAVLAFLLNGLFVAGSIQAINQGEFAIAGVLSFFEAGWYIGNIYGAVNGAHKHNRHTTESVLRNLEQRFRVPPPK